ncbi:MAG: hypothetical protein IJI98_11655 [Methanosphaera sp.]|nr:hypothetical protein [Methanosphaera sp.]
MNKKIIIFTAITITIICLLNNTTATNPINIQSNITNNPDNLTQNNQHTHQNHTPPPYKTNTTNNTTTKENNTPLDKTRPIYFAMDHTNNKDEEILKTITDKLEAEGFNIVSAEVGPNKMSQNTHYLYEHNITNAIIFHLFNGADPSTIRELATNGTDNRGRTVRKRGNTVVLAWFYDSIDCVNDNASGTAYIHASETGPKLENPKQYMEENDIIAICTSSDNGKHKENADYTGEKTAEEFIKLFEE